MLATTITITGSREPLSIVLRAPHVYLGLSRPYASSFHNGLALLVLSATMSVLYSGTFVDPTLGRQESLLPRYYSSTGIFINILAVVIGVIAEHCWRRDDRTDGTGVELRNHHTVWSGGWQCKNTMKNTFQ